MPATVLPAILLSRRRTWMFGLALGVFGLLLRGALLPRHGLWGDELFSLGMATGHSLEHAARLADPELGDYLELPDAVDVGFYRRLLEHDSPPASVGRVVRAVFLSDTSPPLYYVLLAGWTRLAGTGDVALRSFSLVWAMACYPLLWALARRVGGRRACVPVLLLYTVAPASVYYATEGRHYALLLFLTLATMYLTLRVQENGRSGWLLLWVSVSAAGFFTHYFYAFPWAAAAAWLFYDPRHTSRPRVAGACLLLGLLLLPWYLRLPESLANWRVTGSWLNLRPKQHDLLLAWMKVPWSYFSTRVVWGHPSDLEVYQEYLSILAVSLAVGWTGKKLGWSWAVHRRGFLWLWLAAPLVGIAVFDVWRNTYVVTMHRYVLAGMPAAFLLVGLGLSRLPWLPRVGILALFTAAQLGGFLALYHAPSRMFAPFREVGKVLAAKTGPDDLVIVHSVPCGVAGVARSLDLARNPNAPSPGFASWVIPLGNRQLPESMLRLAAGRRRIFLVKIHDVDEPATQEAWLRTHPEVMLTSRRRLESATILTFAPVGHERFFPASRQAK